MDCEVAREALSARIDAEREPVPSARVDEHLNQCAVCRAWFDQVATQAAGLHQLIQSRAVIAAVGRYAECPAPCRSAMTWRRCTLPGVGAALRPRAVLRLAGVLTVFVTVLTVGVVIATEPGTLKGVIMVTHLPVVIGTVLAISLWRKSSRSRSAPDAVGELDIVLPENASHGHRRGHLFPTDGSAA
ncbi:zf-HC2 domain-containing protein [Mycobacterium montefiorense]|nr:zf-HC2 domain-containing protein [Mycobacterium montefiorense]